MNRTFVIAEAGVNHNGNLDTAKRLVDVAGEAGADAVKFQTYRADMLVTRTAAKAAYQTAGDPVHESQYEMLKRLELAQDDFQALAEHCGKRGIEFISTAFDLESVRFLRGIGMKRWKIPSGELTNLPYLRAIGSIGRPLLVSTGMSTLGEIESALDALERAGASRSSITLLHCTTEYPAPMRDVNLSAMLTLRAAFHVAVGYSDHTMGIHIATAAVALGASVIEKHFTLGRDMEGPDHKASIEPAELKALVSAIRDVENAMGSGLKTPAESEKGNIAAARKSIVASRPIAKGELFAENNLTAKRPGTGVSPMEWDRIIGTKATRDYLIDEAIQK
jgi:N,N'-diacetyllegionaminate synthase